ncbi:MAG: hypothetical protein ACFCBW_16830, partial [Candidatus Competibacterales bacterium]
TTPPPFVAPAKPPWATPRAQRRVIDGRGQAVTAGLHRRADLPVGTAVAGPALIVEAQTTTFVDGGFWAWVSPPGHLVVDREIAHPARELP